MAVLTVNVAAVNQAGLTAVMTVQLVVEKDSAVPAGAARGLAGATRPSKPAVQASKAASGFGRSPRTGAMAASTQVTADSAAHGLGRMTPGKVTP